jgi:membrane protease YdiL (CAAX protease family)
VPWDGRDLAITILGGGGIGLFLSMGVLLPLYFSEARISPALQLLVVSLAVYTPICLFGWWFAIKRHGASLADAGFKWVGMGPILLMIPAAVGLIVITGLLSYLTSSLLGEVPTAQEQVLPGESTLSMIDFIWLVIAGAVAAPVAEEFLFRGLFFRYLRARRALWVAILISSVVFAIAHFVPVLVPVLIVFGIAEALVAERYDSLYPAITLHALNNGALFLALYSTLN